MRYKLLFKTEELDEWQDFFTDGRTYVTKTKLLKIMNTMRRTGNAFKIIEVETTEETITRLTNSVQKLTAENQDLKEQLGHLCIQ